MLAVVDTDFPLLVSGFRYWESLEFHKIDKEIKFFSDHKTGDPFPAQVYSLKELRDYPITDIYCVFLNHTLGLLDYPGKIPGKRLYGLSKYIMDHNISIHATIYPGGGYEESHLPQAVKALQFLNNHPNVKTVFTNLDSVKSIIPRAYRVGSLSNTDLYRYVPRKKSEKLQIVFAANHREEKGFSYLVDAFNTLDPTKYHLHVVGDWKKDLGKIKNNNYNYYGTLKPDQLKDVYYQSQIFVNPTYDADFSLKRRVIDIIISELHHPKMRLPAPRFITVDGFPTAAAVDAMSSGCCLISTNSRKDHFILSEGTDYVEIKQKSPEDLAIAIEWLRLNQDKMLEIAKNGQEKILKYCDIEKVVEFKYGVIQGKNTSRLYADLNIQAQIERAGAVNF